jgi:uncharacterized protein YdaU (DUF1376 family)
MPAAPYMRLYVGDYLADTTHLSTLEHGAYLLIIMAYWRNDGPLPDDDKKLARLVGMSPREWSRMRPTIADLFQVTAGQWRHKRIDAELREVHTRSEKARASVRTRYERTTNVAGSSYERSSDVERSQYERTTSQRSEIRDQSRNTQIQGSESPGLQGPGLSPERGTSKTPRAKPDRPKVVWPMLAEDQE